VRVELNRCATPTRWRRIASARSSCSIGITRALSLAPIRRPPINLLDRPDPQTIRRVRDAGMSAKDISFARRTPTIEDADATTGDRASSRTLILRA
jgi:hypothetical protein